MRGIDSAADTVIVKVCNATGDKAFLSDTSYNVTIIT